MTEPLRPRRRRGLAVLLGVVLFAVVVAAAVGVVRALRGEPALTSSGGWHVGDCVPEVSEYIGRISTSPVSCDQPHQGEVFAVLPEGEGGRAAQRQRCEERLRAYSEAASRDDTVEVFDWGPSTPDMKTGNYETLCVAVTVTMRTGSVRE